MSTHDTLTKDATEAACRVFTDTTVTIEQVRESLESLRDYIEECLSTLP